jgi:hypothetical protein
MNIVDELGRIYAGSDEPFLIAPTGKLGIQQLINAPGLPHGLKIEPGEVVAVVGDFSPQSIKQLLELIDARAIVAPLSPETRLKSTGLWKEMISSVRLSNQQAIRYWINYAPKSMPA